MLGGVFGALVDGLLPPRCHHCNAPSSRNPWAPFLCARCAAALRPCHQHLDLGGGHPGHGLLVYGGPCRSLVRALKFHGYGAIGRYFGRAMIPLLESFPSSTVTVVPMPLHWRRQWARGHNMRDAFGVARRYLQRECPPHVVLVDDVITTGATMRAAGARRVWVCAAAVTPVSSAAEWVRRQPMSPPMPKVPATARASSRVAPWPVEQTTSR